MSSAELAQSRLLAALSIWRVRMTVAVTKDYMPPFPDLFHTRDFTHDSWSACDHIYDLDLSFTTTQLSRHIYINFRSSQSAEWCGLTCHQCIFVRAASFGRHATSSACEESFISTTVSFDVWLKILLKGHSQIDGGGRIAGLLLGRHLTLQGTAVLLETPNVIVLAMLLMPFLTHWACDECLSTESTLQWGPGRWHHVSRGYPLNPAREGLFSLQLRSIWLTRSPNIAERSASQTNVKLSLA